MSDDQFWRDEMMHIRLSIDAERREAERELAAPSGCGKGVESAICPDCTGEKTLWYRNGHRSRMVPCLRCRGTGRIPSPSPSHNDQAQTTPRETSTPH